MSNPLIVSGGTIRRSPDADFFGVGQAPQIQGLTGRSLHYIAATGLVGSSTLATAFSVIGCTFIAPSLAATPGVNSVDLRQSSIRAAIITAAAANTQGGVLPEQSVVRGNGTKIGGFFFSWRIAFTAIAADTKLLIGLSPAAIGGSANPSSASNTIGFGSDTGDTEVKLLSVDNVGTITKTTIGGGLSKAGLSTGDPNSGASRVLEWNLWAAPSAAGVTARIYDWSNESEILAPTVIPGTPPLNIATLRPQLNVGVGAGAGAVQIAFNHWYGYY